MNDMLNDLLKTIRRTVLVPIHPAGWPLILGAVVLFFVLWMLSDFLGFIGLILLAWCVYFFRNPMRYTPVKEGLIVSPADGIVRAIEEKVSLPEELDEGSEEASFTRISIFLNVFNVHVNRVPCSGVIQQVVYKPGKFFNAELDKASKHNERNSILIESSMGKPIACVQIAGLIARRIISTAKQDQKVVAGEQYGIIRFGSRMDVYLPQGITLLVDVGQTMIGGETVLADTKSREKRRLAERNE